MFKDLMISFFDWRQSRTLIANLETELGIDDMPLPGLQYCDGTWLSYSDGLYNLVYGNISMRGDIDDMEEALYGLGPVDLPKFKVVYELTCKRGHGLFTSRAAAFSAYKELYPDYAYEETKSIYGWQFKATKDDASIDEEGNFTDALVTINRLF